MATLEKARPPTVTVAALRARGGSQSSLTSPLQSQRNSLGLVPTSPTILRTHDAILLPSVPTHEPEDNLPSPLEYQHQLAVAVATASSFDTTARQGGLGLEVGIEPGHPSFGSTLEYPVDRDALRERDETEEVEELRDDEDEHVPVALMLRPANDLVTRLQRLSTSAVDALLSLEQVTSEASSSENPMDETTSRREINQALQQMRANLSPSLDAVTSPASITNEAAGHTFRKEKGNSDTVSSRAPFTNRLATLQERLGQIKADPADADDLNLATALCALLTSLELVKLGTPATEEHLRSIDDPAKCDSDEAGLSSRPDSAMSVYSVQRRGSFATVRSSLSEELRNPFAETTEADVFDRLYRRLSAIQARGMASHSPVTASPRLSPSVSARALMQNGTTTAPSTLPLTQMRDTFEPGYTSANPYTEVSEDTNVEVSPDQGAWKQLTELVNITKELVAMRKTPNGRQQESPRVSIFGRMRSHSHTSHTSHHELFARDSIADVSAKRVSTGSFTSGHATVARSSLSFRGTQRTSVWSEHSLPPAYAEGSTQSHEMRTKDQPAPENVKTSLPGYSDEDGLFAHLEMQDEKKRQRPAENAQPPSTLLDEKQVRASAADSWTLDYAARTPQDLLLVQNSIERLYTAVPQLLDQRCAVSPEQLRGASLQRMMDRFAATPRLEDQRADPPLVRSTRAHAGTVDTSSSVSTPTISNRNLSVEPQGRGRRLSAAAQLGRKFSVSNLANTLRRSSFADMKGKGKEKEVEDGNLGGWSKGGSMETGADAGSLKDFFTFVDRAQDMSMTEQRTAMKPRTPRKAHDAMGPASATASARGQTSIGNVDDAMIELLNSQGQSRLAGQDAAMISPQLRKALCRVSQPEPLRDADVGSESVVPIIASSATPHAASLATVAKSERAHSSCGNGAKVRATQTLETSSCESMTSQERGHETTPSNEERTYSDGACIRSSTGLCYVLETQPSLGAIHAIVTLDTCESVSPSELLYDITAPSSDGNTQSKTATTARLSHPSVPHPVFVPLNDLGVLPQSGSAPYSTDHSAFRLGTSSTMSSAGSTHHHLSSSEPVTFPLSFDFLNNERPSTLCCSHCTTTVADLSFVQRFRALPSQHWEELVDAWMCHGDQELNESVARGKQGLEEGRLIPESEVWVADPHLLLSTLLVPQHSLTWDEETLEAVSATSSPASYPHMPSLDH